jgi:hypothetical protein
VLARDGTRKICAEDAPFNAELPQGKNQNEVVTWSDDGQSIHFVTRENETFHIVKVDATTGRRTAVLFSLPLAEFRELPFLSWNIAIDRVFVGGGDFQQTRAPFVIDLLTGRKTTLATEENGYIKLPYDKFFCADISPKGTYTAFVAPIFGANRLVILDEGAAVHFLDATNIRNLEGVRCPLWKADESTFYAPATTQKSDGQTYVAWYRYDLATKQTALIYEGRLTSDAPPEVVIIDPNSSAIVTVRESLADGGSVQAYTESTSLTVDVPYLSLTNPLWVPPLK